MAGHYAAGHCHTAKACFFCPEGNVCSPLLPFPGVARGWCCAGAFLFIWPQPRCGEAGGAPEKGKAFVAPQGSRAAPGVRQCGCQQLSEASEVHSILLYYFFFANYFLRWRGVGSGGVVRKASECEGSSRACLLARHSGGTWTGSNTRRAAGGPWDGAGLFLLWQKEPALA